MTLNISAFSKFVLAALADSGAAKSWIEDQEMKLNNQSDFDVLKYICFELDEKNQAVVARSLDVQVNSFEVAKELLKKVNSLHKQ